MEKDVKIAAFEGGELRVLDSGSKSREVVLALPLSRLLVKMVRVGKEEDETALATEALKVLSPYPDEELTVSTETVYEDECGRIVIAAALPESSTDDISEALDAAKLNVVKVDALVLGQLRHFWNRVNVGDGKRRLLKLKSEDCLSLIVLEGDTPLSIRAVRPGANEKREEMLSLLEAEDFKGAAEIAERLEFDTAEAGYEGVAERAAEVDTINAMPASWSEVLGEERFKAKLIKNIAIAGAVWALIVSVLFGVPVVYGFMTDHMKNLSKEHERQYKAVFNKKAKTELVQKYSDHARGALEIIKAVSDRLPQGVTLTSWDFKNQEGLRLRGDSADTSSVYTFKDQMTNLGVEDDGEGEAVFKKVKLGSVTQRKDKHGFDLELGFEAEEVE